MLFDLNRYSYPVFRKESKKLVLLALPMLLAQVAQVGVGFVDTVMAGGAGKNDLAAVALGSSAFVMVYITFLGVMTALNPIISQLYGAGKYDEVGETGRQSMWFGLMMGVIGMLLMWLAIVPFQKLLDLNENVESMMAQYMLFTGLAMPAAMIHRALHAYASSLNRPRVIMIVSFLAFFLNVPLNYAFVYGKFGMPALGGAGCGVATTLVFWFNAAALWLYVVKQKYFRQFKLTERFSKPDMKVFKQIWKLGAPIGLSFFLEVSLFSCIVFLVARQGEDYVAAQQVVISLTSVIYMIPQSIGSAGTVRVAYTIGRREYARARYISGVSLVLGVVMAVFTALLLVFLRYPLAGMYTDDAAVLAIAATVLLFAAVFQLGDATQCVASYALRGYKVTKIPMLIHAVAFWGFGLVPGYLLAYSADMGIYGFWTALVISLTVAAVLLVWYLEICSRSVAERKRML
ncbi:MULTISPECIES: MATE family efflux transporter [unclassified Neisseria]|uniref:MATE family efflux transporter n=1 Tax=unclassified Neisseria TaxID=2623750 RepID=UPI0026666C5C|nr:MULTISPECIES: MATE family efflux transporter [unclassified Neisseria]MDO1509021.1 MATE family efflux transporter [Neisseria sp. MVDL19-042950]MDO1515280.1 MATE family efflux transporter [Neisseria sp. MVDL18-041461]MDO1562640.1 MATE family efflux transporter [Neisseria sp. MVDL20-010259]